MRMENSWVIRTDPASFLEVPRTHGTDYEVNDLDILYQLTHESILYIQ